MTTPAVTLTPSPADGLGVGAMPGTLTTDELLARVSQPEYQQWLNHAAGARGCSHPVRLSGEITAIDPATGELVRRVATGTMPDGVLYVPCGTRRASICPACAEIYRRDARQIIRQGSTAAKAYQPTSPRIRAVFVTLTAPASDLSTPRIAGPGGKSCAAVRAVKPSSARTAATSPAPTGTKRPTTSLGKPLCPDCYDYDRLRRLERSRPRTVAADHDQPAAPPRPARQASTNQAVRFVKVAEYQARGVIHFHASPARRIRPGRA